MCGSFPDGISLFEMPAGRAPLDVEAAQINATGFAWAARFQGDRCFFKKPSRAAQYSAPSLPSNADAP